MLLGGPGWGLTGLLAGCSCDNPATHCGKSCGRGVATPWSATRGGVACAPLRPRGAMSTPNAKNSKLTKNSSKIPSHHDLKWMPPLEGLRPKIFKVTRKWLKSEWLEGHFSVTHFESLWGQLTESLFRHFFVTFIIFGFQALWGGGVHFTILPRRLSESQGSVSQASRLESYCGPSKLCSPTS